MLFKFQSRAAADLIMLEATGRRVLAIIGKEPTAHGIIAVAEIPAAIAALRAAVAEDEALPPETDPDDGDEREAQGRGDGVRLRQRVAPFIEMLERSAAHEREVVW